MFIRIILTLYLFLFISLEEAKTYEKAIAGQLIIPGRFKPLFELPVRIFSHKETEFPKPSEWIDIKDRLCEFIGFEGNTNFQDMISLKVKGWPLEELRKNRARFKVLSNQFLSQETEDAFQATQNLILGNFFGYLESILKSSPSEWHTLDTLLKVKGDPLNLLTDHLSPEVEKYLFLTLIGSVIKYLYTDYLAIYTSKNREGLTDDVLHQRIIRAYFQRDEMTRQNWGLGYTDWFIRERVTFSSSTTHNKAEEILGVNPKKKHHFLPHPIIEKLIGYSKKVLGKVPPAVKLLVRKKTPSSPLTVSSKR